jgi:hypothetical protein
MLQRIKDYPARLQAVVVAAVALGAAFGMDWTGEQTGALAAFSAALIALFLEGVKRPTQ